MGLESPAQSSAGRESPNPSGTFPLRSLASATCTQETHGAESEPRESFSASSCLGLSIKRLGPRAAGASPSGFAVCPPCTPQRARQPQALGGSEPLASVIRAGGHTDSAPELSPLVPRAAESPARGDPGSHFHYRKADLIAARRGGSDPRAALPPAHLGLTPGRLSGGRRGRPAGIDTGGRRTLIGHTERGPVISKCRCEPVMDGARRDLEAPGAERAGRQRGLSVCTAQGHDRPQQVTDLRRRKIIA